MWRVLRKREGSGWFGLRPPARHPGAPASNRTTARVGGHARPPDRLGGRGKHQVAGRSTRPGLLLATGSGSCAASADGGCPTRRRERRSTWAGRCRNRCLGGRTRRPEKGTAGASRRTCPAGTDPPAAPARGLDFLTAAGEPKVVADRVRKSAGETGGSQCDRDPLVGGGMNQNNGGRWAGGGVGTECQDSCDCEVAVLRRDPDRSEDSELRVRAAATFCCVEPYGF